MKTFPMYTINHGYCHGHNLVIYDMIIIVVAVLKWTQKGVMGNDFFK